MWQVNLLLYGAYIGFDVRIKSKITFPHDLFGVFISERAVIGENCVIFQQVTIGSNTLPDSQRPGAPVIGDNVYIGAGVKIIGGVKVGNNVRIGANAVIFTDVPDNCVAVVNGVRTIHKSEPLDNRFMPISKLKYEGENETYIEASAENSGSILYDKEIRDKPRTRRTKRNV